jgi:hypothetical protein
LLFYWPNHSKAKARRPRQGKARQEEEAINAHHRYLIFTRKKTVLPVWFWEKEAKKAQKYINI